MPRFQKHEHLRSPLDFRRVYDRKCSASDEWLIVYALPNDFPHSRLGLSVSRKVGPAVVRNRFRRLYREAFRLGKENLPKGLDLVLIPRSNREPTLDDIQLSLKNTIQKLARRFTAGEAVP